MEQVNFEDVFADLIHSFESAADKVKKITDELEDEVYMRIANDRKAAMDSVRAIRNARFLRPIGLTKLCGGGFINTANRKD